MCHVLKYCGTVPFKQGTNDENINISKAPIRSSVIEVLKLGTEDKMWINTCALSKY